MQAHIQKLRCHKDHGRWCPSVTMSERKGKVRQAQKSAGFVVQVYAWKELGTEQGGRGRIAASVQTRVCTRAAWVLS